jgi:protein regulator of cytokinesis 1
MKAEIEVERLDQLKASRMKEIAFKKQAELEEIFAHAHIEIDPEAAREKIMTLIDSGDIEPTELLADMDNQIAKAKDEALSRKDILDKVEKWMSACEEESWLEDYNRVIIISLVHFFCGFVWLFVHSFGERSESRHSLSC